MTILVTAVKIAQRKRKNDKGLRGHQGSQISRVKQKSTEISGKLSSRNNERLGALKEGTSKKHEVISCD